MSVLLRSAFIVASFSIISFVSFAAVDDELISNSTQVDEVSWSREIASFAWKRVPNGEEIFIDASVLSILDTFLQDYVVELKKSPSAGSVLRDAMKIIPTIRKAIKKVRVGGTDNFYGEDHVYSQCLKVISKLMLIYSFNNYFGFEVKQAAEMGNYPSDILSKAIVNAGKDWKESGISISFESYFFEEFNLGWFGDAVLETTPKAALISSLSYMFTKAQVYDRVRGAFYCATNKLFKIPQNYKLSFMANARNSNRELVQGSYLRRSSMYVFHGLVSLGSFLAFNVIATYALGVPAKLTMDAITAITDYFEGKGAIAS